MDNRDGTLSIFGTMIDHSGADRRRRRPGTDASQLRRRPAGLAQPRVRLQRPAKGRWHRARAAPRTRTSSCSCRDPRGSIPAAARRDAAARAARARIHAVRRRRNRTARRRRLAVRLLQSAAAGVDLLTRRHARCQRQGRELGRLGAVQRRRRQPDHARRTRQTSAYRVGLTDVRRARRSPTTPASCGETTTLRITDRRSGPRARDATTPR